MNTNAPLPEPQTLIEAIRHFADPDVALRMMVELRWRNGVCCPTCGRTDVRFISTRRMWEYKEKHPRRQFSAKVGTIFEDSPIDLGKWFSAIWMIANCKNGVSSYEMHRERWPASSGQRFALDKWTLCRLPLCCGGFGVARREGVARPE